MDYNIPKTLQDIYGHINMGVYIKPKNNLIINLKSIIKY